MARKNTTSQTPPPAENAAQGGYTVLARRYRPQSFADLVGQDPVGRALMNAIKADRVAHAYLFTGARGVGKTSTARILARALNCVNGPTPTPCGTCEMCVSIASGEDVDVLEIDGASNRKIDEIRDIRSNVQYRPSRARFKIYIIDEVHMLTREAFNALLKTLEEPPPHVKFIFATTEVDKVPITILSRCQRFDFAGISLPRIVERLREIVQKEGLQADQEALELVARRAGGSMRDAQSLLDQLLAFGGDRLTADQVHHLLGTAGDDRVIGLADAVVTGDAKRALSLLDEACTTGLQLGELIDQFIAYWRDLMIVECSGTEGRDLSVPARHHETLRKHAQLLSLDAVLAGLDVLTTTRIRLRGSNHARTLVEMALVRLGRLNDLVALSQLSQWLSQTRLHAVPQPPTGARLTAPPEGVKKNTLTDLPRPAALPSGPIELSSETLSVVWANVLANLGGMMAAELKSYGLPAILGPNALVFRLSAAYNQSGSGWQNADRVARVEEALKRVTGRACSLRFEFETNKPAPVAFKPEPPRIKRNWREEAEKLDVVRKAMSALGATIKSVDEGFGEATAPPDQES